VLVEIIDIIDESHRVKRFVLKSINGLTFHFEPGQFVQLFHPELPEFQNTRSYSISSISGGDTLELCIALNEKGVFTPWLFALKVGYQLEISEPQGQFVFKDEYAQFPSVFICTGTGIAPFLSMIHKALSLSEHPVHLVFGNRKFEDVLYREMFENLSLVNNKFHFYPVLSREVDAQHQGYVHGVYQQILRDIGVDARIFICGWKDMCMETRQVLKGMGYNRRQYFFEQYD